MPERMITCSMCRKSRKMQHIGIRDAIDQHEGVVTQMVCAWCQLAEKDEAVGIWPPKVTRWRSINEKKAEVSK